MLSGRPCSLTISLMKIFAVSTAKGLPFMGRKCAILDKWPTTTKMVLNPSEGGRSTIKSLDIFFYGCSGTGNDLNRSQDLVLDPLLRWQIVQEFTYLLQSSFKVGHHRDGWMSSVVFRTPKWPASWWSGNVFRACSLACCGMKILP